MSNRIYLNVGGKKFETTVETLEQSEFFKAMIERWLSDAAKKEEELFIDRDPVGFSHILKYLRDPQYVIPDKYLYELGYYGVKYNKESINDKDTIPEESDTDKWIKFIDRSFNKLLKLVSHDGKLAINIISQYGGWKIEGINY